MASLIFGLHASLLYKSDPPDEEHHHSGRIKGLLMLDRAVLHTAPSAGSVGSTCVKSVADWSQLDAQQQLLLFILSDAAVAGPVHSM